MIVADIALMKSKPAHNDLHWVFYRHQDGLFAQDHYLATNAGFESSWRPFDLFWVSTFISRFESAGTAPYWMACLLWADELAGFAGVGTRHKGLREVREARALRDVRRHTIKMLRQRRLNRWEKAFWQRYDAEAAPAAAQVAA